MQITTGLSTLFRSTQGVPELTRRCGGYRAFRRHLVFTDAHIHSRSSCILTVLLRGEEDRAVKLSCDLHNFDVTPKLAKLAHVFVPVLATLRRRAPCDLIFF